jgi:hypothetical protein
MQVLGQEHCHILPAKTNYKNVFFCHNCYLQLLEPVLFYMAPVSTPFCLAYLSKKDPAESNFSPIWKSLMTLEHEHQDTYNKTFFCKINRTSSQHTYRTKTRNRVLDDLMRRETQKELRTDLTSQVHVYQIHGELTNLWEGKQYMRNLLYVQHCHLTEHTD